MYFIRNKRTGVTYSFTTYDEFMDWLETDAILPSDIGDWQLFQGDEVLLPTKDELP